MQARAGWMLGKTWVGWAAPPQWDEIICFSRIKVSDQITRPSAAVVPKPQQVKVIKELGSVYVLCNGSYKYYSDKNYEM